MERNSFSTNIQEMQNIKYLTFLFPFSYYIFSRCKNKNSLFAWFAKYLLPMLILVLWHYNFSFSAFAFGVATLYSFYEIGYIYNDTECIKKEINPTLRLNNDMLKWYENHKKSIYTIRIFEALCMTYLLYRLNVSYWIIIGTACILPVFMLYNSIRNRYSLFIHIVLSTMRFSMPMFIAINSFNIAFLVIIFITFPLLLFIEISVKGKFGYRSSFCTRFLLDSYDKRYGFRCKYYVVVFLVFTFGYIVALFPLQCLLLPIMLFILSYLTYKKEKFRYNNV